MATVSPHIPQSRWRWNAGILGPSGSRSSRSAVIWLAALARLSGGFEPAGGGAIGVAQSPWLSPRRRALLSRSAPMPGRAASEYSAKLILPAVYLRGEVSEGVEVVG